MIIICFSSSPSGYEKRYKPVRQQRSDTNVFVVEEMDEDILLIILNDIHDYEME
jgi:hypothetical protein